MKYNSQIIIACDFSTKTELFDFLNKMHNKKLFLKLGMQFLYANGFETILELKKIGHNIFIDLKIYDILNTSMKAIESLAIYKPDFISIHSLNSMESLITMNDIAIKNNIKLLGVTVLTSLDDEDLKQLNFKNNINFQVKILVKRLKKANIYGVVSSPLETPIVKKYNLISVTPGIRLMNNDKNDQKRVLTPKEAILNGADFIVIGRTIINDVDPYKIYEKIEQEIN